MELGKIGKAIKDATKRPTATDVLGEATRNMFDNTLGASLTHPPEDGRTILYEDPRIAQEAKNKEKKPSEKSKFGKLVDSDHNKTR